MRTPEFRYKVVQNEGRVCARVSRKPAEQMAPGRLDILFVCFGVIVKYIIGIIHKSLVRCWHKVGP